MANKVQIEDEDEDNLVGAGILQILFGAIGLGRLSLGHITRASMHTCVSLLGIVFYNMVFIEWYLIGIDRIMLLCLNETFSVELYRNIGIAVIVANIGFGILDGVLLIMTKKRKHSSRFLGFFGWLGTVLLLFIGIISIFASCLNFDFTIAVYNQDEEKFTDQVEEKDINYISESLSTDYIYTIVFTVDRDVDYFLYLSYVYDTRYERIILYDYNLLFDMKANTEYTLHFKLEKNYVYKYETEIVGFISA